MRCSVLVSNNRPLMVPRLSETISLPGWSPTTCIHERARQSKRKSEEEKREKIEMERKEAELSSRRFSKGSEMDRRQTSQSRWNLMNDKDMLQDFHITIKLQGGKWVKYKPDRWLRKHYEWWSEKCKYYRRCWFVIYKEIHFKNHVVSSISSYLSIQFS